MNLQRFGEKRILMIILISIISVISIIVFKFQNLFSGRKDLEKLPKSARYLMFEIVSRLKKYRYFKLSEFDCPTLINSGWLMKSYFVKKLDDMREIVGFPLVVTSGYRTTEKNDSLPNSSPISAHLYGLAADIAATNSAQKKEIIKAALKVGINRIGIMNTAIHLDVGNKYSSIYPSNRVWYYDGTKSHSIKGLISKGYITQEFYNNL